MWKDNKVIIIAVLFLSGCSCVKKEKNVTILKSHIEQYVNIFIEKNEKLSRHDHFIIIHTKLLSESKYILGIGSEVYKNIYFYEHENDTIYSCNYKGFKVLVFGEKNLVVENVSKKNIFTSLSSDGYVPIQYDGIFWELRIKSQKLIDFKYQFCEPDTLVFRRLKSIPISK